MNKITGEKGFLLTNLLSELRVKNTFIHFGGPSCREEFNETSTNMMIQDVKNIIKFMRKTNYHTIIFASSAGAVNRSNIYEQELYNDAKLKCEQLIIISGINYRILRIPRVYGSTRKKGLMKYIKEGSIDDYTKEIQYYDIDDFVKETAEYLNNSHRNGIKEYNRTITNTIQEIKEKYVKD